MLCSGVQARVFKCSDDNGNIIFTDRECKTGEALIDNIDKTILTTNTTSLNIEESPLGKNILLNPSFENKLIDWLVPLGAHWTNNGGINSSAGLIIHASKPPDDRFIYETTVEQCIPLESGEMYQLKAKFKFDKPPIKYTANRANVIWYESIDCTTGGQWGAYLEPKISYDWQSLERNNIKPALDAKAAKITLVQNARYSNDGQAFWDDIHFAPSKLFEQSKPSRSNSLHSDPGFNLLLNGAFYSGLQNWSIGWKTHHTLTEGAAAAGAAKVTAHSTTGSTGKHAMSQCVDINPDSQFEIGASFKRDELSTQEGGGRLRVTWYEKPNCQGRAKTDINWRDPENKRDWQKIKITGLTSPTSANSAKIEIIQHVKGYGEFTSYWDDVYFMSTHSH